MSDHPESTDSSGKQSGNMFNWAFSSLSKFYSSKPTSNTSASDSQNHSNPDPNAAPIETVTATSDGKYKILKSASSEVPKKEKKFQKLSDDEGFDDFDDNHFHDADNGDFNDGWNDDFDEPAPEPVKTSKLTTNQQSKAQTTITPAAPAKKAKIVASKKKSDEEWDSWNDSWDEKGGDAPEADSDGWGNGLDDIPDTPVVKTPFKTTPLTTTTSKTATTSKVQATPPPKTIAKKAPSPPPFPPPEIEDESAGGGWDNWNDDEGTTSLSHFFLLQWTIF